MVKDIPDLMKYFPEFDENELPDRSFMWGVLFTLRRDEWVKLVDEVRKRRCQEEKENKDELIEIDQDYLNKLMAAPIYQKVRVFVIDRIYSIAKGRVAYLLRSSRPSNFPRK